MKHHCNPLLKSWEQYLKSTKEFVILRRYSAAVLESEVRHRMRPIKKKGRR